MKWLLMVYSEYAGWDFGEADTSSTDVYRVFDSEEEAEKFLEKYEFGYGEKRAFIVKGRVK